MTPDSLVTFSWILGRCDWLRAEVYVRAMLPAGVDPASATLSGTLTGPECKHAITLPVTAKLTAIRRDDAAAAADTLVARAILTEPSSWTPELPNLYRLEARLEAGGQELAACQRPVGLRRLGVRGRSLWLDGRRYVPRGVAAAPEAIDVARFRAAALAAVMADPADDVLARCDAEGVAVIALLADEAGRALDVEAATAAIACWAWHPAVLVAVVPRGVSAEAAGEIATNTRTCRDTLLLAREVDGTRPPPSLPAGIDLVVVTLPAGGLPHEAWRSDPPGVPLLARRTAEAIDAADALEAVAGDSPSRRECDAFQAALAGWGTGGGAGQPPDWAGYLVG
jgi:hypothetical protein